MAIVIVTGKTVIREKWLNYFLKCLVFILWRIFFAKHMSLEHKKICCQ